MPTKKYIGMLFKGLVSALSLEVVVDSKHTRETQNMAVKFISGFRADVAEFSKDENFLRENNRFFAGNNWFLNARIVKEFRDEEHKKMFIVEIEEDDRFTVFDVPANLCSK